MYVRSRTLEGSTVEVSRVSVGGVRDAGSDSLGDLVMVLEGVRSPLGQHTRTLDPRMNEVERIEVEK